MSERDRRLAQTRYAGRESASQKAARKAREKAEKDTRRGKSRRHETASAVPPPSRADLRRAEREAARGQVPSQRRGSGYTTTSGQTIEDWYEEYRKTPKSRARRSPMARLRGKREAAAQATLI